MKRIVFVPVFNQQSELPSLLSELRALGLAEHEILIINNGSTDGSLALIKESGFVFLDLPMNRGVGHSFMWALDYAMKRDYELFAVIAGNGKMIPAELERVCRPVLDGTFDYVTGSRFLAGGDSPNLPQFRKKAIPMVSVGVKSLYGGVNVTDPTCGYKAFSIDILRRARFDWRHVSLDTYGFEYYLYGKVILDPTSRWCEVPVTMRYPKPGVSYTKIKPFTGWYQMLKPWVTARFDGKILSPK